MEWKGGGEKKNCGAGGAYRAFLWSLLYCPVSRWGSLREQNHPHVKPPAHQYCNTLGGGGMQQGNLYSNTPCRARRPLCLRADERDLHLGVPRVPIYFCLLFFIVFLHFVLADFFFSLIKPLQRYVHNKRQASV
jgi:hypothetical protein